MRTSDRIARNYWDVYSKRNDIDLKRSRAREVEWNTIRKVFNIHHDTEKEIVDFACGTGYHAIRFLTEGFRVTGIDISQSSLDILKKRTVLIQKGDKLNTVVSDFSRPILLNRFDAGYLICSYHCLGFDLKARQLRLRNMIKMIKKGGKFFMMEPNPLNPLYYFFYPFVYKSNWREGYNIINSRLSLLRNDLIVNGIGDLSIYHYGLFPTFLINYFKQVENINQFLCSLPIVKRMSAFHLIVGRRTS